MYERARTDTRFEMLKVSYRSDGLPVVAFIYRPSATGGKRPVVVFNRGSHVRQNAARELLVPFHRLADAGFVVVAPMYRGSERAAGRDEMGGAELADLVNIQTVIASLPYADPTRTFLYGESRGGMMTLQALRDGFPARAAAIVGVFTDLDQYLKEDPNAGALAPKLKRRANRSTGRGHASHLVTVNARRNQAAAVCEGHQGGDRGGRQHVTDVVIVGDHARGRDEDGHNEERKPPLGKKEGETTEEAPEMGGVSRGERVANSREKPIVHEAIDDRLMRAEAVEHGLQHVNRETRRELDQPNPDHYSSGRSGPPVQGEGACQGQHGEARCIDREGEAEDNFDDVGNLFVVTWTACDAPLTAIATGTSIASIDNATRPTRTPAINSRRHRDLSQRISICVE